MVDDQPSAERRAAGLPLGTIESTNYDGPRPKIMLLWFAYLSQDRELCKEKSAADSNSWSPITDIQAMCSKVGEVSQVFARMSVETYDYTGHYCPWGSTPSDQGPERKTSNLKQEGLELRCVSDIGRFNVQAPAHHQY